MWVKIENLQEAPYSSKSGLQAIYASFLALPGLNASTTMIAT